MCSAGLCLGAAAKLGGWQGHMPAATARRAASPEVASAATQRRPQLDAAWAPRPLTPPRRLASSPHRRHASRPHFATQPLAAWAPQRRAPHLLAASCLRLASSPPLLCRVARWASAVAEPWRARGSLEACPHTNRLRSLEPGLARVARGPQEGHAAPVRRPVGRHLDPAPLRGGGGGGPAQGAPPRGACACSVPRLAAWVDVAGSSHAVGYLAAAR